MTLRSRNGMSSCSERRSSTSREACERPVSRKLRCRAEISAPFASVLAEDIRNDHLEEQLGEQNRRKPPCHIGKTRRVGRLHVVRGQRGELGAWFAGLDCKLPLAGRAGRIRGADAQHPVLGAVRNLNELVARVIGALCRGDLLSIDTSLDLRFSCCTDDPERKPVAGTGGLFGPDLHAGALPPSWARRTASRDTGGADPDPARVYTRRM